MWGIKFLNGPLAGQIIPLQPGANKMGRATNCRIQVPAPGISKEHLEIMVAADKVLLNDLKSSNGTYLNGTRIKGGLVQVGDKISIHNILFEVIPFTGSKVVAIPKKQNTMVPVQQSHAVATAANSQAVGQYSFEQQDETPVEQAPNVAGRVNQVFTKSNDFVENVALPGVYRLPQIFDFKQVVLGFIGLYIILVTLLSVIPMKQITSEAIENESFRRALTVARSLAASNEKLVRANDLSNFSTEMILREEGVADVYIVSKDGIIVAPPERTGTVPKEVGFIRKVRGLPREFSESVGDGKIAAAVPVLIFDPELQQNTAKAHAVVIFNPSSLTYDDGRAFSLFIQMLFIAFIIGGFLFFFLYKLIEYPFRLLNNELDLALREGRDQANVDYNLPVLQNLMTNINSLLARAASAANASPTIAGKGSRDQEIFNLMQLMGYPCILISRDAVITKMNGAFESLTGVTSEKLVGRRITEIPDPAMPQNFQHLMNQSQMNMNQIVSDKLEVSGHMFMLSCQAISSAQGDIEYFLISISQAQAEGGAA